MVGRYYVESDGKMARDKWVDGVATMETMVCGIQTSKRESILSSFKEQHKIIIGFICQKKEFMRSLIYEGFNGDTAQYAINHIYKQL